MCRTHNIFLLVLGFAVFAPAVSPSAQAAELPTAVQLEYATEYQAVLMSSSPVTINQARMYQESDHVIVSGRVRRMHEVRLPGKVLSRDTTRVAGLNSNRKGKLTLPFRFSPAAVPPQGAKISLRYHDYSSDDEILECPKSL
jgi:hypothetical protein